ncbi:MAG: hypothetical protein ABW061_01370 [Polyangiaceae bacterium]
MAWSAQRLSEVELLMYEAQAKHEIRDGLVSVCVYDLTVFRADLVIAFPIASWATLVRDKREDPWPAP